MGIFDSIKQMAGFGGSEEEVPFVVKPSEPSPVPPEKPEPRPQDDVPAEQIVHYIVRDYQRMWGNYNQLLELAKLNAKQIEAKAKKLSRKLQHERPEEVSNLQIVLQERNKTIADMKEELTDLKKELCRQRRINKDSKTEDYGPNINMTIELQRKQIRSLLEKLEDLENGSHADDNPSWHTDRWKAAMEQIETLLKQLVTLRGIVTAQSIEPESMTVVTSFVEDCRRQVLRIQQSVAHTAPSKIRMAYKETTDNK